MQDISKIIAGNGGVTKVAAAMGIPIGTVSAWMTRNSVPADKAISFESITGVSRHALRPDVFGPPPRARAHTRGQRNAG